LNLAERRQRWVW